MSAYIYCQTRILLQNNLSVSHCKKVKLQNPCHFFPTSLLNATFFNRVWHLTLLQSTFFLSWRTECTSRSVRQEWRLEFLLATAITVCINVLTEYRNLGWVVLNLVGNVWVFNPHTSQQRNRGSNNNFHCTFQPVVLHCARNVNGRQNKLTVARQHDFT